MPWVYVEFGLDFVLWADYTLVSLIEFDIFDAAAPGSLHLRSRHSTFGQILYQELVLTASPVYGSGRAKNYENRQSDLLFTRVAFPVPLGQWSGR